jgi:hypothetical protein
MTLFPISAESQAYADGYKNGRTDRSINARSEYAWYGVLDNGNTYSQWYSRGYQRGWLGLTF